ncbi:ATP-binding protein [Dictyobacter aurantiacus]|uniref:AAA+ ATPase domain-containing protein n=1 Tax=Dictyobacter aurantiacus TaxID=1936993 RepID=A0A401ZJ10_9CHLR|nr:ATP-binding protein [Dictyobacter aurantiacus]GCE06814.1 hypothetical protein KDAU_41430 [Dictyobacter aurantiacus]
MKTEIQEQGYIRHDSVLAPTEEIRVAWHGVYGITLLRGILAHEAGLAVMRLLQELQASKPDPVVVAEAYSGAFYQLLAALHQDGGSPVADAWQAYLIQRLIDDSNLWSTAVEAQGSPHISSALRTQAQRDLRALQRLFRLDAQFIWEQTRALVTPAMPTLDEAWVPWQHLQPPAEIDQQQARHELIQTIAACPNWEELVGPLEHYWSRYGTGKLARYHVLRWDGASKVLSGIQHPDPIQLSGLIGHERQQTRILANVERFLAGLPAHNMLLYGPPGTGKSSTIKAIANTYADQGLCLLEVGKEYTGDLPQIVSSLRGRAPHYLLFIDDLSFEEHDTSYKNLKVLLEGTAEARPANVLICATSNRMNLVKENFGERGKPTEDVNWRDTMDEKQSLAHRFGLRVSFFTPDQLQYLHIVRSLVQQRQLTIAEEELQARALQWERQHAGRSGRSARQFVDDLEAEIKYQSTAP